MSDLTPLGTITNLKSLSLDFNPVTDVSPLGELANMEFLSIDGRYSNDLAATVPGGLTAGFGMVHELTNPAAGAGSFGISIATMDNRIVVGAPFGGTGLVFVYSAITGERLLTISNPGSNANFGWSVATLEGKIIAGAPGGNGAVYVFDGATGKLLQTLNSTTPQAGSNFGLTLAVVGGNDILVGAPAEDYSGFTNAGAMYLFDGTTGVRTRIPDPAPTTNRFFGSAQSAVGTQKFVAGSGNLFFPRDVVYLFDGTNPTIVVPVPAAGSFFGYDTLGLDGFFLASGRGPIRSARMTARCTFSTAPPSKCCRRCSAQTPRPRQINSSACRWRPPNRR